jgi:hypothetical protein
MSNGRRGQYKSEWLLPSALSCLFASFSEKDNLALFDYGTKQNGPCAINSLEPQ